MNVNGSIGTNTWGQPTNGVNTVATANNTNLNGKTYSVTASATADNSSATNRAKNLQQPAEDADEHDIISFDFNNQYNQEEDDWDNFFTTLQVLHNTAHALPNTQLDDPVVSHSQEVASTSSRHSTHSTSHRHHPYGRPSPAVASADTQNKKSQQAKKIAPKIPSSIRLDCGTNHPTTLPPLLKKDGVLPAMMIMPSQNHSLLPASPTAQTAAHAQNSTQHSPSFQRVLPTKCGTHKTSLRTQDSSQSYGIILNPYLVSTTRQLNLPLMLAYYKFYIKAPSLPENFSESVRKDYNIMKFLPHDLHITGTREEINNFWKKTVNILKSEDVLNGGDKARATKCILCVILLATHEPYGSNVSNNWKTFFSEKVHGIFDSDSNNSAYISNIRTFLNINLEEATKKQHTLRNILYRYPWLYWKYYIQKPPTEENFTSSKDYVFTKMYCAMLPKPPNAVTISSEEGIAAFKAHNYEKLLAYVKREPTNKTKHLTEEHSNWIVDCLVRTIAFIVMAEYIHNKIEPTIFAVYSIEAPEKRGIPTRWIPIITID